MNELLSIIILGLTSGAVYGLLGLGFGLIFFVTGRFHFAFSVFTTMAAYIVGWGSTAAGWNIYVAIVLALIFGVLGGVSSEVLVYRLLDRGGAGSGVLGAFIASLGLVIAGTAVIQLIWSSQPSYFYQLVPLRVWRIGEAPISQLQLTVILSSVVVALIVDLLIVRTSLGRQLRAMESSAELARTYGLNVKRLTIVVFAIGSFCLAVVGILRSAQFSATSTTGSDLALYALLVAFLSQGRRPIGYLVIGVLLGVFEAACGRFLGGVWQQIAVFIVLFALVSLMPYREAISAAWRRSTRSLRRSEVSAV
jgi:branched-chain amino acid transport system permease protein